MNPNPNLKDRILKELESAKPHSKLFFQFITFFTLFLISILIGLSILSITFFIWDIVRISEDIRPNRKLLDDILEFSLFELVVIAGLLSWLIFVLFRRLDITILKHRFYLILTIITLIIGLSIGGFFAVEKFLPAKDLFREIQKGVELVPHRKGRDHNKRY